MVGKFVNMSIKCKACVVAPVLNSVFDQDVTRYQSQNSIFVLATAKGESIEKQIGHQHFCNCLIAHGKDSVLMFVEILLYGVMHEAYDGTPIVYEH
jgi:hypothetical protein